MAGISKMQLDYWGLNLTAAIAAAREYQELRAAQPHIAGSTTAPAV